MNSVSGIWYLIVKTLFSPPVSILPELHLVMLNSLTRQNTFFLPSLKFLLIFFPLLFVNSLSTAEPTEQTTHKAAIFIENRAGKTFDSKVSVLEDFITSRITEKGYSVISREAVIGAFRNYSIRDTKDSDLNMTQGELDQHVDDKTFSQWIAPVMAKMLSDTVKRITNEGATTAEGETPGMKSEQHLDSDSSVLRLAQMMGADYIIVASITSFGSQKKVFEGYGVKTVNLVYNLRASYKILDAVQGGSMASDMVKVSKTLRFTEHSMTEDSDVINELLVDAAVKIAESLEKKQIASPPPKPDLVEITITCNMQDIAQLPITIPDIRVKDDNTIVIEKERLDVQVLNVAVEFNGTVIGSTPGTFKVPPGLNKIRLTREGFRDWERTVNVIAGQKLNIALQMNEAGYTRWKDNIKFLQKLKNGEKLTDATAEIIKGGAQMLKQSGYKVDAKTDIKGNLKSVFNSFFW